MNGIITRVKAINFQSHETLDIDFHKGVNIIKGNTHSGKTSINRLIRWVILNRPSGTGFKSHFADDKDPIEVSLYLEEGAIVTRKKDKKFNGYIIKIGNTVKKFEAIRTDVPDEVAEVLQMDGLNIHGQHDGFFWIDKTAGQVAKDLNETVGLEIIDISRTIAQSKIDKANAELKSTMVDIEKKKTALIDYKHLEVVKPLVENLDKDIQACNGLTSTKDKLNGLIKGIKKTEIEIKNLNKFLEIEPEYKKLYKEVKLFHYLEHQRNSIESACTDINNYYEEITITEQTVKKLIKKFNKALKKAGVCPLCNNKIK